MKTLEELKQEFEDQAMDVFLDDDFRPIHEIARDIYNIKKQADGLWDRVKEEAFDYIDDRYSKEEAKEAGIKFSYQNRFDEKSFEKDAEYMMLKEEMKNRKELLKGAYAASEKGRPYITDEGEEVVSVASKKGVKILTYER